MMLRRTFYPVTEVRVTEPVLISEGEGEILHAAGVRMTIKLPGAATGGQFCVVEYDLPAGFPDPPPHVHFTFEFRG